MTDLTENAIPGAEGGISVKSTGLEIESTALGSGVGFVVMVNPKTGKTHVLSRLSNVTPRFAKNVSGDPSFPGSQVVDPHAVKSDVGSWQVDPYRLGETSRIGGPQKSVRDLMAEGWEVYAVAGNENLFLDASRGWGSGSSEWNPDGTPKNPIPGYNFEAQSAILLRELRAGKSLQDISGIMADQSVAHGSQGKPVAALMRLEEGKSKHIRVENGIATMDNTGHEAKRVGVSSDDSPFSPEKLAMAKALKKSIETTPTGLSQKGRLVLSFAAAAGLSIFNIPLGIALGIATYNSTMPESERTTNVAVAESATVTGEGDKATVSGSLKLKDMWYALMHPIQTIQDFEKVKTVEMRRAVSTVRPAQK